MGRFGSGRDPGPKERRDAPDERAPDGDGMPYNPDRDSYEADLVRQEDLYGEQSEDLYDEEDIFDEEELYEDLDEDANDIDDLDEDSGVADDPDPMRRPI